MADQNIVVLATLKAVDMVSGVLDKVSSSFAEMTGMADDAAAAAEAAGSLIDQSLLSTASGADAVDLAAAKAATAQEQLAAATREQAAAEQELLDMRGSIASEEELAQAARELAVAQNLATQSTEELARAQTIAKVFKEEKVSADLLESSLEQLALAEKTAASFANELSAAQERQNALITESDVAAQAKILAGAERDVAAAAKEAEASWVALYETELHAAAAAGDLTAQQALAAREAEADAKANDADAASKDKNAASTEKAKTALFGATAALAAIGYESVKTAINFQTLTQRLVTTAGESQSQLQNVRNGIMQVAAQTGASANDLAQSMYTVEAAGYSAAKGGIDVLRASTEGATLEGSDFTSVANAVTDVLKDYHYSGSQAALVTSQLVAAVANGKANFQTMASAMGNVVPVAASVGLKFADVAGVLASMTNHGITAQRASQNLATALISLRKPTAPMIKEFGAVGISVDDLNNHLSTQGLGGTLNWLAQVAQKSAPALGQTYEGALAKLMGTQAGLKVALETTGENAKDTTTAIKNIASATQDANGNVKGFTQVQKTAGYQFGVLKASIENTGIAIGTALLPAVTSIAGEIGRLLTPVMKWIQSHQSLVKNIFEVVAGIVALIGAIKLVTTVVEIFEGVMTLLSENPWVAAITALVLVVIYCYTHFKTFRDIVQDVMKVAGQVISSVVSATIAVFHALAGAAEDVWHALQATWDAIVGAAKAVWSAISDSWNAVMSVTTEVWDAISGFFKKWWPLLLLIFATPIALLIGIWNHFHNQIESVAKAVWNGIKSFLGLIWDGIKMAAQGAWMQVQAFIINPIKAVWSFIQPFLHTMESFLSGVWNFILSAVKGAWDLIKHAIIDPLVAAWNWLNGWVNTFTQIGMDIINGIINGISNAAGWLFDKLKNLANDALNAAKSILGIGSPSKRFRDEIGKWIPHGIAQGVDDNAHVAHAAVKRLANGLSVTAKAALGTSFTGAGSSLALTGGVGVGSSGASELHIHIDLRGAQVMSDRDMDLLTQKIGKRLATVVLPSGGYRSRF